MEYHRYKQFLIINYILIIVKTEKKAFLQFNVLHTIFKICIDISVPNVPVFIHNIYGIRYYKFSCIYINIT